VCTDSRGDCAGRVFFALAGESADGHDHIGEAVSKGAAALVVNRNRSEDAARAAGGVPVIDVPDTLKSLQRLSAAWRDRVAPRVVGITGSVGKTGTKELLASVLALRHRVYATQGNYNNHIGVPLTLLSMGEDTQLLVVEMGASAKNEIRLLASIARPETGIITNIASGHLESFGTIKGVAKAKAELIESLPEGGAAVLPADDEFFAFLKERTKAKVVSFGFSPEAGFRPTELSKKEGGGYTFTLSGTRMETSRYGRHHVLNAACVVAAASLYGISPEEAAPVVAAAGPAGGRGAMYDIAGITFVDDSYNCNPASLTSAVDAFMEMPVKGRRWLVLGDMLELGEAGPELHAEMGTYCGKAGVDGLLTLGQLTVELNRAAAEQRRAPADISHFIDTGALAAYLDSFLASGDCVLVKGSRSMHMEKVIGEIAALRKAEKRKVR
jgi:UDP-N-acetylmuramoyl-tripeptide--D-alanyl-D-alanine ligase